MSIPPEHNAQAVTAAEAMHRLIETCPNMAWGLLFQLALDFPEPEHPVDLRRSKDDLHDIRTRRCLHDELRYLAICQARDWARLAHPIQLEIAAAAALNAMPPNLQRHFLKEAAEYFAGGDHANS